MGEALSLLPLLLFAANVFTVRLASPLLGQQVGFLVGLPVLAISSALPVIVIPVSLLLRGRGESVGWVTVAGAGAVVCGVSALLLR